MKLCEHLAPLYQNEIRCHNRPLFVSTPSFVDPSASAAMYVHMEKRLQEYTGDGIRCESFNDYHFPAERYYVCEACRQCLSGPAEDGQRDAFSLSQFDLPHEKVIATRDNIDIEDGVYGKFMVPTVKISD